MSAKIFVSEDKQLTIKMDVTDKIVQLNWTGKCTMFNPISFIDPVLEEALSYKNTKIVMNFSKLEFMISSGLSSIIKLLEKIKKGSGEIELLYSHNNEWQSLDFTALKVFCTPDKRIQINKL